MDVPGEETMGPSQPLQYSLSLTGPLHAAKGKGCANLPAVALLGVHKQLATRSTSSG